jgi:Spy/CpxP family protein refolding chaperone
MMRRSLLAFSSVVVAALATGCSGSTTAAQGDGTSTAAAAQAPQAAPIAPQAKGHVRMIADALGSVSLQADQRAEIEQLAQAAETRRQATAQAHADVAMAIASQVESGTIDRAALQPKIDAATAAMTASQPADRAAFERLHAILTPDQRTQLVTALKSHGKAMHGDHHKGQGPMEEWKTDLALTDDQVDQIKAILKASRPDHHGDDAHHGGPMGHGHAVLEAFASDHFVMDEVAPAPDAQHVAGRSGHMLDMIEKVLPILTQQQRVVAASKIRARAQSGEEGPALPF